MSEKIAVLQERAARLGSLLEHPGWQELKAELERKKERHTRVLLAELLGSDPIDQRKVDWHRGFWSGCEWLLANPEMAEQTLENALKRAQTSRELTSV